MAMDAMGTSDESLSQASTALSDLVALTKAAVAKEQSHISKRLQVRENREPHQDKEMTAFLAMQQDERADIDRDFEEKKAALERVYSV